MSVFAYDDSGAPVDTVNYTTLVILHGTGFNKNIFKKLLPLGPKYQIRVVVLNRRGYPGSTPFTDEELRSLDSPDEHAHEMFFNARAQELAEFLADFAIRERLPKPNANCSTGGIALMGWSSASSYALCLLSHAPGIAGSTRKRLEPFLRSVIVFDAPGNVAGRSIYRDGKLIAFNTTYTVEERFKHFNAWLSAYFNHASVTSHKSQDLQLEPDPSRPATTSTMSKVEHQQIVCNDEAMKVDIPKTLYPLEEFERWLKKALFEDDMAKKFWPKLKVDVIWCERSPWTFVEAGWAIQELRKESDRLRIKGRPLRITMMPGVNHFAHWDEPDKTMAFFVKTIDNACIPAARF
ncbi:hypothetical protein SCHPADRAFT_997491 [Schizopora paradoxa]|uniref:AB hydrolase-1 domain-containing protein n=1 Tax=Schizopora paradoxa TaxID=27342 RepID=A0A0H2RUY7_9AGAM|nr:hypothetical protein SCHPADRAFT_997491 [Schizopora paradoxa]